MNGKGNEMAGHTPGPWVRKGKIAVDGANEERVAEVAFSPDADLIAAAPELLEALKAFEAYRTMDELASALRMARAAVARAEGRG